MIDSPPPAGPVARIVAAGRRWGSRLAGPRAFVWHSLIRVPWLCFYNVLGAALLVYLFAWDAQGLDLLRISTEHRFSAGGILWNLLFLLGTFVLSLSFWYSARLLLGVDFPTFPLDPRHARVGRVWLPRVLGVVVPLTIGLSFFRLPADAAAPRDLLGMLYLVLAGVLLVFYVLRRRLPGMDRGWMLHDRERALPARDLRIVMWSIIASFVLLAVFMVAPVRLPQVLGAPAIIVLGIAGIALFGSMLLTYAFLVRGRPAGTTFALLLALIFGFFNDNHRVRQVEPAIATPRPDPVSRLQAWRGTDAADAGRPLVLVAASGGGIRAAYWTAAVLAQLEAVAGFREHLFAISGVSGGSLGAATYLALRRQQLDGIAVDLPRRVRAVLAQDFLSPVVAGLLFPDLAQRFLPFPVPWADRQRFLELAWEAALGEAGDRFREPFAALHAGDVGRRLPSLLLNATLVETGQRAIVSDLALDDFPDTLDLLGGTAPLGGLPLSAAAGLSARFTYVSPAGTVPGAGGAPLRVVDGGYFENSGAATVLDLLRLLRESGAAFTPVLVLIDNDPVAAHVCRRDRGGPDRTPLGGGFNAALSEATAPFETLLNTRQARGRLAQVEAARAVEAMGGTVIEVSMAAVARENLARATGAAERAAVAQRLLEPPLGWSLSRQVRRDMDDVIDQGLGGLATEFRLLGDALGGAGRQDCQAR